MRISDWSSDVCSSDLAASASACAAGTTASVRTAGAASISADRRSFSSRRRTGCSDRSPSTRPDVHNTNRSEEHTSELQSLMRISYAVFCLKKKKTQHIKLLQLLPLTTSNTTQIQKITTLRNHHTLPTHIHT